MYEIYKLTACDFEIGQLNLAKKFAQTVIMSYKSMGVPHSKEEIYVEVLNRELSDFGEKDFLLIAYRGLEMAGFLIGKEIIEGTSYLSQLCVFQKFQRTGLGGTLVKETMKMYDKVCLCTRHDNANALKLYHKLGFQVVETRDWWARTIKPNYDEQYIKLHMDVK